MAATLQAPVAFDPVKFRQTTRAQWESAAECARFERESFGALHQMMSGLNERARAETWQEIEAALGKFEGADGFVGPCEMLVGAGTR